MRFFDPYETIRFTENRLPHWQQTERVYFITFRLADALPKNLLEQWDEERANWLKWHPPPPWTAEVEREYRRKFSARMEAWLDAGHGSCVLRRPDCAAHVVDALRHFDRQRVALITFVIMPNHVHVLFALCGKWTLEQVVHSWKRHSAVRINRVLGTRGVLWQRDYFDRLIRNQQHFANAVRYIRRNPGRAKLQAGDYRLYESDAAAAIGTAV